MDDVYLSERCGNGETMIVFVDDFPDFLGKVDRCELLGVGVINKRVFNRLRVWWKNTEEGADDQDRKTYSI